MPIRRSGLEEILVSQYLIGPENEERSYYTGINPDGNSSVTTSTSRLLDPYRSLSEPVLGYLHVFGPKV